MKLFRVPSATCALDSALVADDPAKRLTRYTRDYVVAAMDSADAVEVIRVDATRDGATLIRTDEPVEESLLDVPIFLKAALSTTTRGVRWKSGRTFLPPE
jgi:hypothetical protein